MTKQRHTDEMLKEALAPAMAPDEAMNLRLKASMKEAYEMKAYRKPIIRTVLIAAMVLVLLSATALAAWSLLSPGEVAAQLESPLLAAAFEGPDALIIGEAVTKGDCTATLLGIVSGKGLQAFEEAEASRTYAVVAIEGSDTPNLFVSPLIKGLHPWEVNIASMGGGYGEKEIDGVQYRIIECDSVEMFADRGLYLCVSSTSFYDTRAYDYDEETGTLSPNPDFKGFNALFDLPLDPALGDPEAAEAYLAALRAPEAESPPDPEMEALQAKVDAFTPEMGTLLADSVQEIAADEDGYVTYTYDGSSTSYSLETLFAPGQVGMAAERFAYGDGEEWYVTVFVRDAEGVIQGMVYQLP